MNIKKYFLLFVLICIILQCNAPQFANAAEQSKELTKKELTLDAPQKAAIGTAFIVRVASIEPVKMFTFSWMKKNIQVPAINDGKFWYGELLLPVPLGSKDAKQTVQVSSAGFKTQKTEVGFFEIDRPVQKLNVDPKFVNPPAEMQERIAKDRQLVNDVLANISTTRQWVLPLTRPAKGDFSSPFGVRRVFNGETRGWHRGLDIRGATGDPILAAADGKVVLVEDLYFSGNSVYIDHGLGFVTAYIHMSATNVIKGQNVQKGELIGKVGATGRVTGPHLHFSMLVLGQSVDARPFLEKNFTGNVK